MSETVVTTASEQQFRVLINSVGTARPSASAAVAKGLGLPASTVIARMYRAPAVLVDRIDKPVARRMAGILTEIGYQAEVQDMATPAPDPAPLNDVAIYIKDASQVQTMVKRLASFVGISEADATKLILTPPGVVLGSVSDVTVEAFTKHMGDGVSILSSRPCDAIYDLFVSQDEGIVQTRILADMERAGLDLCGTSGAVAVNVDHETARDLWKRHQGSGLLKVVNQDFLRFDLILCEWEADRVPESRQIEALEQTAGIPSDLVGEVLKTAPITLLESVPSKQIEQRLTEFTDAGLDVRADLITFQMLGLEVLSISNHTAVKQILQELGLHDSPGQLPRSPFRLHGVMPELQARIARAALEGAGSRIGFVEAS